MYFDWRVLERKLSIKSIMDVVFSGGAEVYKSVAVDLLSWIKELSREEGRKPEWVSSNELAEFIRSRYGESRKTTVYKVIKEFLIPMGFLDYVEPERKYFLSKNFSRALRRISKSYLEWYKS